MTEPLLQLAYTLTSADALAYESLPRELAGWHKLLFFVWLGGAGMVLALLPPEWTGPEWGWRFWLLGALLVGLAWLVAAAVMTLSRHRRAVRRIPIPVAMELRQWPDHLEMITDGKPAFMAYETIADVTATPAHVFVTAPPNTLIVPASAFSSPAEMAAFAEDVDRLSRQAVP